MSFVVSADLSVLELAQHWGVEPLSEMQAGHNPALHAAALTLIERAVWRYSVFPAWTAFRQSGLMARANAEIVAYLLQNEGLLTLSADLPLLALEDLQALIQQSDDHQIVLASSSDGTGTNALLTRPPLAVPYLFGPNSLSAYIQAAQARQISYTLYHNPHLAFDIDTPEDLQQLGRSGEHTESVAKTLLAARFYWPEPSLLSGYNSQHPGYTTDR